jgi:hypothetical protein
MTSWRNSDAKKLLLEWILEGRVAGMKPKQVYALDDIFKPFKYDNFVGNLNRLRKKVGTRLVLVEFDQAAFDHDQLLYPTSATTQRGYPRWPGHEAKRLLKEDIDEGKHETMTPLALYKTRPAEYGQFPLDVFRDHLYQEVRGRKERGYWLNKKKKKEARLARRAAQQTT